MLVTWYDFLCHSDVTLLPPLYRYPLSIAWLRVRVARYTHPVYSPSGSCHSDVTSLRPLYRYPLSIAWLRVWVARYTFLFSLAWPWRMKSLVKHNMLKKKFSLLWKADTSTEENNNALCQGSADVQKFRSHPQNSRRYEFEINGIFYSGSKKKMTRFLTKLHTQPALTYV